MSMANNWNKLKGMNIQHTITGHPLLNGVLWLVADEDWGEAKGELGRVKWRKSRWRLFIKCDLVGRYASSNSFLRESKFGWLVRVVRMVVRGLVHRVVPRVVRGVGSVFSTLPCDNSQVSGFKIWSFVFIYFGLKMSLLYLHWHNFLEKMLGEGWEWFWLSRCWLL